MPKQRDLILWLLVCCFGARWIPVLMYVPITSATTCGSDQFTSGIHGIVSLSSQGNVSERMCITET